MAVPMKGKQKGKPNIGIEHKSPSDTTIYRPALIRGQQESDQIINKISNFVENIRIETASKSNTPTNNNPTGRGRNKTPRRDRTPDRYQPSTSRMAAEAEIVNAENNKARLQPPTGNMFNIERLIHNLDDDDEFFYVTCHIDSNIKEKIGRGEFINLECLLPKDKTGAGGNIAPHEDSRVEIVSRNGHTYFKPVKENQITGLRHWEQAFRVYAAIYTEINPHRAAEIWQYMHTINVAASAYHWDNVASYDLTFRQLMAHKPQRNWAKLYHQGWNLSMREPLGRQNNAGYAVAATKNGKHHDWRDDCCWKFNKNNCNYANCQFDHRCTYCGGWGHGHYNCRKRLKKSKGNHNHQHSHTQNAATTLSSKSGHHRQNNK